MHRGGGRAGLLWMLLLLLRVAQAGEGGEGPALGQRVAVEAMMLAVLVGVLHALAARRRRTAIALTAAPAAAEARLTPRAIPRLGAVAAEARPLREGTELLAQGGYDISEGEASGGWGWGRGSGGSGQRACGEGERPVGGGGGPRLGVGNGVHTERIACGGGAWMSRMLEIELLADVPACRFVDDDVHHELQ